MDLTDMMKEASIVDHSWAESLGGMVSDEPLIDVEELKNPNNIKPELEVQWGGGGPEIDIDEPAGVVERNLGDESPDVDSVIMFARDQMNRGLMGRDLNRALQSKFDAETLKAASEGLAEQLKLEGIVGCVAIDGRGYMDCKEALKASRQSPYKGLIRYVIGCECGTPHTMPKAPRGRLLGDAADSTGSAVDDFLADSGTHKAEMVPICRSTALPILGRDELDASEVNAGLIDMMTVTGLPEDVAGEAKKKGGLKAFQAAFRWLQETREAREKGKYAESVDASEHVIEPTDMPVDVAPEVKREAISVNAQPNRGFEIDVAGAGPSVDGVVPVNGAADQLPVEFDKEFVAQEVEPGVFLEEEFEGTDEVELDEEKTPPGELGVEF